MSMYSSGVKPGEIPPIYDEVMLARKGQEIRHASSSMPWWNPRYWRKRIWATIIIVILVIVIIIVAVAVERARKNMYPDYSPLSYTLKDTYGGESFFDQFNYFTGYDPTEGFVHYVPEAQAKDLNLTYVSPSTAVLKVDTSVGPNSKPNASTGRFSVRIESKKTYENGLFIFDVKHTPYGCGTWPALWLTDRYMESTNKAEDGNQMTLHTTGDCSMDVRREETGKTLQKNCNHEKDDNAGCGVLSKPAGYGSVFNKNGGGVMAVEWRHEGIRMWQFGRDSIPSDIKGNNPKPDTWGTAVADFPNTHCDIGTHFKNQSIIANIDLCGSLVYHVWDDSGCSGKCTDLVANNPEAFENAYWEFGTFQVYQAS
ncbi:unnamed protein product [Fusarium fujikuroi]|nr:hypothetical protein CEK25_007060 [Fusarium fujikuroi]VZI09372.1 unnamed protein product [Fusarium fujikuroi]